MVGIAQALFGSRPCVPCGRVLGEFCDVDCDERSGKFGQRCVRGSPQESAATIIDEMLSILARREIDPCHSQ